MDIATIAWLICLLLALALGTALSWGWRLKRALHDQSRAPTEQSPNHDEFSSLFKAATEALDTGVAVVDDQQTIRFCNQRCLELLDRQLPSMLGRSVILLLRDFQGEETVQEALQTREQRESILQPAFSGRILSLRIVPLAEGGALLLVRDLTRISQLERARRDLVANVSHELRTPLAALQLLLETLETAPPLEVTERMYAQMQAEVAAMTKLVDDLHKLSELESGRLVLKLRATDVAEMVERALERVRLRAEQQQIRLTLGMAPDLPAALVDQDRIDQVLLNLLDNAIKFTPPGGQVSIMARCTAAGERATSHEGKWIEIVTSDSGPGIPANQLSRIFERFYKVDRARTHTGTGGTGLGLAIAKHIVEGHGGRIWAESTLGQGSRFHILLPPADTIREKTIDSTDAG